MFNLKLIEITAASTIAEEYVTKELAHCRIRLPDGRESEAFVMVTSCNMGFAPSGARVIPTADEWPALHFEPTVPTDPEAWVQSILDDYFMEVITDSLPHGARSSIQSRIELRSATEAPDCDDQYRGWDRAQIDEFELGYGR